MSAKLAPGEVMAVFGEAIKQAGAKMEEKRAAGEDASLTRGELIEIASSAVVGIAKEAGDE